MDSQPVGAPAPSVRGFRLLLAPWERLSMPVMVGATALEVVTGLALAPLGVRFDGAWDVHRTWEGSAVSLKLALIDQVAALLVASLAVLIVLRVAGYRARADRVLPMLGIVRLPLVLTAPAVLASPTPSEVMSASARLLVPPPGLVVNGLLMLLAFIWFIALLVSAVRTETGTRGGRLAALVLVTLVTAEALSKVFIGLAG